MGVNFEFVFQQAFSRLGQNSLQTFSQEFEFGSQDGASAESRQQFLLACALHGLIQQNSVGRLLGESSSATSITTAKYAKESLVAEFGHDARKLERLLNGVEGMDGNASTFAEALIEVSLHGTTEASADTNISGPA